MRSLPRPFRLVLVTLGGVVLILLGVAGLALPVLPGWLLIAAGLGVLSLEYHWAARVRQRTVERFVAVRDRTRSRRSRPSRGPGPKTQDGGLGEPDAGRGDQRPDAA